MMILIPNSLQRIIEITGLSPNLNIQCTKGLPLYIETRIGNIGTIASISSPVDNSRKNSCRQNYK
jgi:hypothetical protein